MSFLISCPGCQSKLRLPETVVGKTIRCPKCAHKLKVSDKPKANGVPVTEPHPDPVRKMAGVKGASIGLKEDPPTKPIPPVRKAPPAKPNNTELPTQTSASAATTQARFPTTADGMPRPTPTPEKPVTFHPPPRVTSRPPQEDDEYEDSAIPDWISAWGAVAFGLGAMGLLAAQLVGSWLVTVALCVLGGGACVRGIVVTQKKRKTRDRVWLTMGGGICGVVLVLAYFAPGVLNTQFPTNTVVIPNDPNKLVVVDRDKPREEGTPLDEGDWADAEKQAIRQDDALVRLESVQAGVISGKNETSYLLIHFRLVNLGGGKKLQFDGFNNQDHQPILKDDAGRSYGFLEQRPRKVAHGPATFEEPSTNSRSLSLNERSDMLLVFELPTAGALNLELPTSAWGRQGVCRIRISRFFESLSSDKK